MKYKKALITGADGFIGSHLTELLLQEGYTVKALTYYNSFNFRGWLEDIPQNSKLEILAGDIRDTHFVKEIMKDVDIVFHLAALIAIPYSYHAVDSYIDTNIRGTLNVCQTAKDYGNIRVIITSTSEVYGTAKYVPIDEKHPKQAQSPYSASKIGADALAMSFYNAFNLPVTIARPFNTYGPRQSARAIIPSIIAQIANGNKIINIGDLSPTRDLNFVTDTCQGFLALGDCENALGKEVNICSNYEISMKDILKLIIEIMGAKVNINSDEKRIRPKKSEVYRLWGDNSLIKTLTNFEPKINIKLGLAKTCNWFNNVENLKKYKSEILNF